LHKITKKLLIAHELLGKEILQQRFGINCEVSDYEHLKFLS